MNKKIIIAAGGSGGHLFPALALANRLKEKGKQIILLISSKKIDKKIAASRDYPTEIVCPAPRCWCGAYHCFLKANRILNKYKPAVVVGFGGKNSIPLLLLSVFKRIPTLIHEQNVLSGKANWLLSKFVNKIAISFSSTKRFFPPRKVVFTGNPLRREIFAEGLSEESISNFRNPEKFVILIMGGSQGAHRINTITIETLKELSRSERDSLRLIHLCGERDYSILKTEYSKLDINYSLFPFLDRIGNAYAAADLVISRAGATSIAEIIALKKAALLIPYSYAHSHQKANADLLFSKGAGMMLEEKDFSPQYLKQTILALKNNPEKILKIKRNLEQFAVKDAAEVLAKEVIKLGERVHPVKSRKAGISPLVKLFNRVHPVKSRKAGISPLVKLFNRVKGRG